MFSNIINTTALLISLVTASSVFLHDTRLDKAAIAAVSTPADVTAMYQEQGSKLLHASDAHTHVERVSLSQTVKDLSSGNPRVQPRNEDKKYMMQSRVRKGHHAFDNYNLPIV
jgi:hypothetical protein